jgi:hypothetical protein
MAFIHEGSCECTKSELDLFSVPPTQTSIESATFVEYRPIASLTDGAPIEFEIASSGDDYLDFANSYLQVKVKIERANGNALDVADTVGPVNNFLHSLFSQVDVSFNDVLISNSSNTYPYRAYLENLLTYGPAAKKSQLTACLFYQDESGKLDKTNPLAADVGDRNSGLVTRATFTSESKEVDLVGRIHSDVFFQQRYILNEVNTKIRLTRSKDVFCLSAVGAQAFKVRILSAAMLVRKVKVSPSIYLAHARTLENGMAKYPIRRVICKSFTIPAGFMNVSQEKLFSGQLPTRLVLGCVDNRAFNGDLARNPFNFQHFQLKEVSIYLDGQNHGIRPLITDFESGQYVTSFMSLFSGTGKENRDEGNNISRSDYAKGFSLYAFDLSSDLSDTESFNLAKHGNVRVNMNFGAALAQTVTVIVYAEFENIIEIDRNRNIVFDFNN